MSPLYPSLSDVTGTFTGVVTANLGTIADVATQTTLSTLNGKVTACNTGSVAGTVTANLGTIADVATQTTLNSLNGKVTACNTGSIAGTVNIQGYNETNYVVPHIDPFTASWQFVDYPHHEIHEGDSFTYHDVITLGSAGVQDYVITVPDTTKWPHFVYAVEGIYGITLELYEAGDRVGTTAQTIYNRNRNSGTTATTTVHKNQSGGSSDGTRIMWRISGSGAAAGRLAGATTDRNERVLKRNTKYIFRITSAAASNTIAVEFDWYEHTDETP
jgi:hypothetical protein